MIPTCFGLATKRMIWQGWHVPSAVIDDLPPSVQSHLPLHAQEIYRAAFNSAWVQYAALGPMQRERTAHRVAWAAVKHKYEKAGDLWVPRPSVV